jgi:hypothetical protein
VLGEEQAQAGAVDAAVVRDDGEIGGPMCQQRFDQEGGYAGEPEPADSDAGLSAMSATASSADGKT